MENILKIAEQKGMRKPDVSQRTISDMKPVFKNHNVPKSDSVYYTVYRNLEIIGGKIRYDITVLPQKIVGGEFTKTFGHYHEKANPELYEVLDGRVYFLLQQYETDPSEIREAYLVQASLGDQVVMPPGFGHLSVNIGKENLVLANWIGTGAYDYDLMKNFHGGCYYVLLARQSPGDGGAGADIKFEKNPNYRTVPELKKLKLKDAPGLGIKNGKDYPVWDLKNDPKKLMWLSDYEKHMDLLTIENLYKKINGQVVERQTRTVQGRMPQGVGGQIPPCPHRKNY